MLSTSNQKSSTRYSLLVFLILSLFLCAILLYIRNSKVSNLNGDIKTLTELNEDYSQIDSCIVMLYNAENNSRFFAITGDKKYIKDFTGNISFVAHTLDDIQANAEKSPQNLKGLIAQKELRTQVYVRLKKLTDSLIRVSAGIDTTRDRIAFNSSKELTFKQLKTMTSIDTIKPKNVQNKRLLARLADAFAKQKGIDTASFRLVRKEVKLDTSSQNRKFNKIQLRRMNNYFRNLYAANRMLNKNEIGVLQVNSRIITEIVSILKEYKTREMSFFKENKYDLKSNIDTASKKIDRMFVLSIGLLFVLVAVILYNLWKIFQNENELVNYGQKATQYALSKSRFLANMSHEIRTPLNSVIGFSEQLSQGKLDPKQEEQITAIRSSSLMLLDVVNDILDFSKYETGKVSFDKNPFFPFAAINEVLNSISIQTSTKNITLKKEISFKEEICFNGDALRLKQVLMNLLSNAIKFTDKGSVMLKAEIVHSSKKQGLLKIKIVDTGIGISSEDLDMIFDEFAQVYYSSSKIAQKGTGLGLAICKKIIEFQGGKIGVTSTLEKGSTFSFEIPYEICAKEKQVAEPLIPANFDGLAGKRILLADDNKMNILLIKTVLDKYNLIIDIAQDGKQAYDLFEKNEYNLILTDIEMPEMGGVGLTEKIRSYHDLSKTKIPILGVTANVLLEDRKKYINSGINDLVLKPFSERELMEKILIYLPR